MIVQAVGTNRSINDNLERICLEWEEIWDLAWSSKDISWWFGSCTTISLCLAPVLRLETGGRVDVAVGAYRGRNHCFCVAGDKIVDASSRQFQLTQPNVVHMNDSNYSILQLLSRAQESMYRESIRVSAVGVPWTTIKQDFWM